ncbi:unnamed protein product [Clonostachys rosea]|uniref:Arf-GAP domain-containing protein n=1 Tax=Bionectria ochroleuca TaxID=29856 RepID=A0ABY6UD63_BIOOC|nr:unnamed protein product [Clonostachys rosea]
MASVLSKRQQQRNEKVLHDLVQTVPGNNSCADCHARNPAWASWSLGVFLCMRCASIHRKLGTHVSKVKSLSMDSWTNEQVDNMRKVGNVVSNQIYNSDNKKPPVPVDVDEADGAMERFIRQKYMNNVVATRDVGPKSPRIDEGVPPPLPPKNSSSKFGLRAASSLFPLSSRSKKDKALPSPESQHRPSSHDSVHKPAKVFGAALNFDDGDELDRKLAKLRDMGFNDTQRNLRALKAVDGNVDQAIELLVQRNEADRRSPAPQANPRPNTLRTTKSLTPLNSGGIGLSLGPKTTQDQPATPSSTSTNPFDALAAQPQTAQSTGALSNNTKNPYNTNASTNNPFGPVRQQTDPLSQAFEKLDVSSAPAQQQLFPNRTGGLTPMTQSRPPLPSPQVPSAPTTPQFFQQMQFQNMAYPQSAPLPQQPTGTNPFFASQASPVLQQAPQQYSQLPQQFPQQQIAQQNLAVNTQQSQYGFANNPFARSPTRVASPPILGQIPEQSQSSFQNNIPLQSPPFQSPSFQNSSFQNQSFQGTPALQSASTFPAATGVNNPFLQGSPQPQAYTGQLTSPQQQYFQPTRPDKSSIMALYNAAPTIPTVNNAVQPVQASPMSPNFGVPAQPAQSAPISAQPFRSMTLPPENTNNPFANGGVGGLNGVVKPNDPDPFNTARHISRESVNLGLDMAWTNGRHSPDAFASLSAKHI